MWLSIESSRKILIKKLKPQADFSSARGFGARYRLVFVHWLVASEPVDRRGDESHEGGERDELEETPFEDHAPVQTTRE